METKHPLGMLVTLFGGPRAGMAGSPGKQPLPLADGRILVCTAQRGECRYNYRHSDTSTEKGWTLPQVIPSCDRRCCYREEVADAASDGARTANPEYDVGGFSTYKRPTDACGYGARLREAEAQAGHHLPYEHDAKTCPECSQPHVVAAEGWVDVVEEDRRKRWAKDFPRVDNMGRSVIEE